MRDKNLAQVVYGVVREEAERLLPQLSDPQPEVREAAAEALGRTGAFESVPALIALLNDSERRVRWAAAGALGQIGSADAVPALVQALEEKDAGLREVAAQALGEIGSAQAVEALLLRLGDSSGHVRLMAIEALGQIGSPEALPRLQECVKSGDISEQFCAAEAIERIRSVGAELLEAWEQPPVLVLADHPLMARFAEGVRGGWRPEEREHVTHCDFCQHLVAAEWSVRHPEIKTLAAYAADSDAFPDAAAMRRHLETHDCRRCVLLSRSTLVKALAALIKLGRNPDVKAWGLLAPLPQLQHMAPAQAEVYAFESERGSSLTLHEGEGHALLVSADVSPTDGASGTVRLEIIGEHGHRAEDLRPAEDRRLGKVADARREFGEEIVVLAATASPESLAELATWLTDASVELRLAAAQAVAALGAAAATPEILDHLMELLRDPDSRVRYAAARVLKALGPAAARPDILDCLLGSLRDTESDMRRAAAEALGKLGATAVHPEILDQLTKLLRDEDENVRKAAEEALARCRRIS
jgi:HEAT repeat protein